MLQLAVIRQQADFVKQRLRVKNFDAEKLVDSILSLDEQRKQVQLELETAQAKLNAVSKEIGDWIKKGDKEKAVEQKQAVAEELNKASYYIERNANAKILFHAFSIKIFHIVKNRMLVSV